MIKWFWVILKMNEFDKKKLSDQTKFRLNEIKKKSIKENHAVKNWANM